MDPGFPRLIRADWRGIPQRVNAAFKLEGKSEKKKKNRHVVYVYSHTRSTNRPTEIEVCNFFVFSSCLSLWKAGGVYRTWNTTSWNRQTPLLL